MLAKKDPWLGLQQQVVEAVDGVELGRERRTLVHVERQFVARILAEDPHAKSNNTRNSFDPPTSPTCIPFWTRCGWTKAPCRLAHDGAGRRNGNGWDRQL